MSGSSAEADGRPASTPVEPRPAFWIRVDDVMSCIASGYEQHLGRQASFAEVKSKYDQLGTGSDLAAILASIADSKEAWLFTKRRTRTRDNEETFAAALGVLYQSALGRTACPEEVATWFDTYTVGMDYADIIKFVCESEEAQAFRYSFELDGGSDGRFVQAAFDIVLHRGAGAREIAHWRQLLASGQVSRAKLLSDFFQRASATREAADLQVNDTTTACLYGQAKPLTLERWAVARRSDRSREFSQTHARFPYFAPTREDAPLVSIITSLYGAGHFIESFLDNILSQSIIADCELIIVDAASPDGEREKIEAAARGVANIVYTRLETRVGIYAAWNLAIAQSRGRYLTNANLDDCRRRDSIELQVATLQALPFVDIVHQDVYFSLEANLPFDAIAAAGFRTAFPNANAYSLMDTNSPHNAPMWRRSLHEEIGVFDENLASAADYDFWMRCAERGKCFYKLNEPHVGYFYNPRGISTRADTVGFREIAVVTARHARALVASELTMPTQAYDDVLRALGVAPLPGHDRSAAVHAALLATAVAAGGSADDRAA